MGAVIGQLKLANQGGVCPLGQHEGYKYEQAPSRNQNIGGLHRRTSWTGKRRRHTRQGKCQTSRDGHVSGAVGGAWRPWACNSGYRCLAAIMELLPAAVMELLLAAVMEYVSSKKWILNVEVMFHLWYQLNQALLGVIWCYKNEVFKTWFTEVFLRSSLAYTY